MLSLQHVLHPVDFLSHLLHLPSPKPAATCDPATDNSRAAATPAKLDRDDGTVYEPPFVQEMMMDLP